jgi:hypothetical protein
MNTTKILRPERLSLKNSEFTEKWLQDLIEKEPSMLGLGDLRVVSRERRQCSGGRIDFLMTDDDSNIIYEVEIMLGRLDESHIIRAIEYWDLERRRYPNFEHVAVVVAEDITNRFFNVISLINRSVPIIALQLNALKLPEGIILNFTKVLDTFDQPDLEETEEQEETNRAYWDKRASTDSMGTYDAMISEMKELKLDVKETFNKGHIAISTPRRSFCWPQPRKSAYCFVELKVGEDNIEKSIAILDELGIVSRVRRKSNLTFSLRKSDIESHKRDIFRLITMAYEYSF